MNYNKIQQKIEATKFLIQRDGLIMPSDFEKEIISLVTGHISEIKSLDEPPIIKSEYDIEMKKVSNELAKHFDDTIVKKYDQEVLDRYIIHQCLQPRNYSTSFCGPQIPWNLNIPVVLDELSYIYIGHEVIHVLKEGRNYNEWIYLLLYSEVLPMLYEFIQVEGTNLETRIIQWRLKELSRMYKNAFNEEVYEKLQNNSEILTYYQMHENIYFISFYYTILLYSMYKQNPKEILTQIQNVLQHKITTKTLLERFKILNTINKTTFNEEYNRLILKKII